MSRMLQLWKVTMSNMGLKPNEGVCRMLLDFYGQPVRHYHNHDHIEYMLHSLANLMGREEIVAFEEVSLAIWFHDAIYWPGSPYNESMSSKVAAQCMLAMGVNKSPIARICGMIMCPSACQTIDTKVFYDLDFAILGETTEKYNHYARCIHDEYCSKPVSTDGEKYIASRLKFLEWMLRLAENKKLYNTVTFTDLYNDKALENMTRERDSWNKKESLNDPQSD